MNLNVGLVRVLFLAMASLIFWLYRKRGSLQLVQAGSVTSQAKRS